MNISPHHQRPTNYPWPGRASGLVVILGIAVIVIIGLILITDPFTNDDDQADPAATRTRATAQI